MSNINHEKKTRICSGKHGCGKEKPWSEFSMDKRKGIPVSTCKECIVKYMNSKYDPSVSRKYYQEHRDELNKKSKARYHAFKK